MKSVFYVGMGFALYLSGVAYGGKIEGALAPVVSNVSISRVDAVYETRSRIWGSFQKVRDCSFEGIEFRLGTTEASSRADLVFEEASKQRNAGWEDWGPWLVQLDRDQLYNRAYAIVYHRCHPFWLTETRFW